MQADTDKQNDEGWRISGADPEFAYKQMAEDECREAEALEWAEALLMDIADSEQHR